MKIVDGVTSQGGAKPNEDRFGHSGPLAWVIDGATDLETDAFLPAVSDVQWLVDRLDALLGETSVRAAQGGPDELVHTLSLRIGEEMRALGFPLDRIHPTCSLGLLIADGSALRLGRIGDPTCLALGRRSVELSTDFFGRQESRAVGRAKSGGLEREDVRRGIVERRQQYIEGRLAESVFSGHPRAHPKLRSVLLESAEFGHILLCSDGFARAVVDYGLYPDWRDLVRSALDNGLHTVVAAIREHEQGLSTGAAGADAHFKKSDDATAVLVAV